jgi:uncharacterized membrane protein
MVFLVLGIVLFIGIHLLPSLASLRQRLMDRFGERAYKGIFSLISLAGFGLLVFGKAKADFIPVWTPPAWGRHLALSLMPIALMLLAAAYLPSNVKRLTPHPMLWGVTLWAAVHLAANGDLASIILFGSFGVFALFDIVSANARGAAIAKVKYPAGRDLAVVAIGLIAYGLLLFLHPYLFGVPALA